MSTPGGARPSPMSMPPRRTVPVIPPAPTVAPAAARPRTVYKVATDMPRRGWPVARVWADSGVLLFVGTHTELPGRFSDHYRGRVRVPRMVEREVRSHSKRTPAAGAPVRDHQRVSAASRSMRELLLGPAALPITEVAKEDLAEVAKVAAELERLGDPAAPKKHGGEAEVIVLAMRAARTSAHPQVLLTNDGGASVVASGRGLRSRHAGDVLAELACADDELDADTCWQRFSEGTPVSEIALHWRPRGRESFVCSSTDAECGRCDALPPPPPPAGPAGPGGAAVSR